MKDATESAGPLGLGLGEGLGALPGTWAGYAADVPLQLVRVDELKQWAVKLILEERTACAHVARGARYLPNDGGQLADAWCSASVQIEQAILMRTRA